VSQGCGFQRPAIESYNHQTVEFKKGEQIFVLLLPTASLFRKARAHTHLTAARTALEVPAVLKYGHGCKASPDACFQCPDVRSAKAASKWPRMAHERPLVLEKRSALP
jgi:hypothetical protein